MPSSETTPLLVVSTAPRGNWYLHHNLRRTCSFLLGCLLIIVIIIFRGPSTILPRQYGSIWSYIPWTQPFTHSDWPQGEGLSYDQLQRLLLDTPSAAQARKWSEYYTSGPHLTGKNISQALWIMEKWKEFGVEDTSLASYDVYLNYPLEHRLALLKKNKGSDKTEVTFEASLEEDVLEEDPASSFIDRVPTFHGYSASGNVTAQFLYANYGLYRDFEDLINANISVAGKIAIVKYGRIARGLKVKRAQEFGMVGVVIYSDPQDDGEFTEENGYAAYPNGPARNPSAVERGSALFLSMLSGDPTTPGYPSKPGCERQDPSSFIPSIPSLPISYRDVIPFLKALNTHGPKAAQFNEHWQGGGLGYKGVEYHIGPSPEDMVINLYNLQEYITTPLWNVIGVVKGHIPDEVIILGNHRDAWAGGAADPGSGSAAMNEVIRSFGEAMKTGWKPLRTIIFASWDGEEQAMLGSTEWVEENLPWLSRANIAYLNVDGPAAGTSFTPRAAPLLHKVIHEVTGLVEHPNQTIAGQTVRDVWNGDIQSIGTGGDFISFQVFAGTTSFSLEFLPGKNDPVWHYHSNYDSLTWMEEFGDPDWSYHIASTKLWALAAARLVESPVIAFSAIDYAAELDLYLQQLKSKAATLSLSSHFDFGPLERAIVDFRSAAAELDAHARTLEKDLGERVPWYYWWKKVRLLSQVRVINEKYKGLEWEFLFEHGLDGRPWFKHVVFAPGLWTGYSGTPFPGLVESLDAGDVNNAKRWGRIIEDRISSATKLLSF